MKTYEEENLVSTMSKFMVLLDKRLTEIRDGVNASEPLPVLRTDGKQIEVAIRCIVMQMGDIDNVQQEFTAYLYLSARYTEPNLRGVRSAEDVDWSEQWDPRINFINGINIEKDQIEKKSIIFEYDEAVDAPVIQKSYKLRATFKEKLELEDFPFDFQELNVTIMSDWPDRDVKFVKDMGIKDSINTVTFTGDDLLYVAAQTWDLQPYVLGRPLVIAEQEGAHKSHRRYPYYNVTTHVSRHAGYFIWNIALVMFVIMGLTFCSFAVPTSETGDRLGVSVTLLLTSVAFKFIVSQSLPTISYLTILDLYVLTCMIMQVLITIQNAISSIWSGDDEKAKAFDLISGCILGGLVVLGHIGFIIAVAVKVHKRNKTLRKAKEEYNNLCDVINEEFQKKKKTKTNRISPSTPHQELKSKDSGYTAQNDYRKSSENLKRYTEDANSMSNRENSQTPRSRHGLLDPLDQGASTKKSSRKIHFHDYDLYAPQRRQRRNSLD